MGIILTRIQKYCDDCAAAKAMKRTVPKVVDSSRKSSRPVQRIFMDLAGRYPKSTGGAKYLMQLLDDYTNFGWTVFLGDKSGSTVVRTFRTWYVSVKRLMGVHGEVRCVVTDNGTEWVNEDFRTMLVDLGITRELTVVDGSKNNGRVERRIALVSEGAKAAFVEFPNQFPDITFPARTKSYAAIWPEAFTRMNDCLNITAAVHKDDKRCGKRRVKQMWPFMMPGFRHRNRPTKMLDKTERCFHLNSGNDHSSDTHNIITPAGIPAYSAHCTFEYRRQAFQGEVPTRGGVLLPLRGRGRLRHFHRERHRIRRQRRHLHAAAAGGASWISLLGEGVLPAFSSARAPAASAAPREGGIPPMSSSGAAATSAAAATYSRGGAIPAAVPAAEVTGGTHVSGCGVGPPAVVGASRTPPAPDPSVGARAATGERLATEQKQE